jgi:polysaccharide biosynthesis protein PslG
MDNPLFQHLNDIFARLSGRTLILAGTVWVVIFALGLSCLFGIIELPRVSRGASSEADPSSTPTAVVDEPVPPDGVTETPAAIVLPTPTPDASEINGGVVPIEDEGFEYGIAAHAIGMPEYTMGQIKEHLGLKWVKQQVRWDHFSPAPGEMDWSGYDAMMKAAADHELKVMLSVVGSPEWSRTYFDANPQAAPPDDMTLFVDFVGELVDRYHGNVHAIEVWNEQNLDREWDTAEGVNAQSYVEMLRLTYQAIKSRDPSIMVISGALSPTGVVATDEQNPDRYTVINDFVYFQQMIDAGFLDYADCVGAHHNGYNLPPDVAWDEGYDDPTATFRGPFDSPHHSWSFKSTLFGYHDMIVAAGYDTPLCVTEFGWATSEGFDGTPPGFEFADDNTLEDQARWDVEAFQLMREWGFVKVAYLWNLDYSYKGGIGATDPNAPYSILDLKGAARPAYGAIGDMPKPP